MLSCVHAQTTACNSACLISQSNMSICDSTSGVSFWCLFGKAMEARGSVWETCVETNHHITSSSIITLETGGQVECTALWDTVSSTLYNAHLGPRL